MTDRTKVLNGLRLLIAEDEGLIALDLAGMLESFGCHVVGPVGKVDDVLPKIDAEPIDGALLDVNLRQRQVFEVLPELLKRGIKVILTSGYDDATLFPPAFRNLPRIAKPFNAAALKVACEAVFLA